MDTMNISYDAKQYCEQPMKVSIIIPTYNRAALVRRAVESVLQQSVEDIEVIVVDDGSTDRTKETIESIAVASRCPIRYIWKPNGGCASARNVGLREATGDAFIFLDSDDVFSPQAISSLVKVLQESGADFVYSPAIEVFSDGTQHLNLPVSAARPDELAAAHFFDQNVRNGAVLFRSHVVDTAGYVDESLQYNEDSDFLQRVAINYRAAYSADPTVKHCHHEGNKSSYRVAIYKAVIRSYEQILVDHPSFKERLGRRVDTRFNQLRKQLLNALITAGNYQEARALVNVVKGPGVPAKLAITVRSKWPLTFMESLRRLLSRGELALQPGATARDREPGEVAGLSAPEKKTTVLQSFPTWLPQTQTWMYNQVLCVPGKVENHVVCERTENLDQFWLPNIHSLSEMPRRYYYWDKGLRKLRIRRHLGLLARTARHLRADVLHSHFGNIGWMDLGATGRPEMKRIVTFYGQDVTRLPRLNPAWFGRYRNLFEKVDRVLCEGPHMARSVAELGCPEGKIVVHHLGVMMNELSFQHRTWSPEEPLRVLIAASFREKKGIPYALEALGLLQREVPLQVTIIGDADKEPANQAEKQKILATIEKHGLRPKVRLLGYQPHAVFVAEAYGHHVFLSPSVSARDGDTEGGAPVAIIESAATGMPVIATNHCDIPEVVLHGRTGLLAEERDVDDLVRHLTWLVDHPRQWPALVMAGRKRVEAEFDAWIQGERLMKVYEEVLGER